MAQFVLVFDFDKTIIDCDSDNHVIDELGGTKLFCELLEKMPWNSAMDKMMEVFHSQGTTIEEMEDILRRAPMPAKAVSAIKAAYALGCGLRIVSDANTFFIDTVLKHHGLEKCFAEINTNPSYVNEEGRLRISPYHDFINSPHGCSCGTCPPNMCKGKVIERIQSQVYKEGKRVIYLGDGQGDYCPALRLQKQDYLMPRRDYPVWELIAKNPTTISAEIHGWSDADELERELLPLITVLPALHDLTSAPQLCGIETIASYEMLPKTLPVHQ